MYTLRDSGQFGATWPQYEATWGNLGATRANLAPSLPNLGATWPQLGPNLTQLGPNLGPTWSSRELKSYEKNMFYDVFCKLYGIFPNKGQLGATWGQLRGNLVPTWPQLRANLVQNHMNSAEFAAIGGHGLLGLAKDLRPRCQELIRRQGARLPS